MNQREKLLATLVALLGLIFLGYFVWSGVQTALGRRTATLNRLHETLEKQDLTLRKAAVATRLLGDFQKRSLPSDRERAHSVYQQWLLNLVDKIGFADPSVKVAERRVRNPFFDQSDFDITGEATLTQLTEFLADFYASNDLHRVSQLSITPVANSRTLDILVEVEALSLPNSQRMTVGDTKSPLFLADEAAADQATILNRSMFFAANQPPQIESVGSQEAVQGSPFSVELTATDPDSWDELQFTLDGEVPAGLELKQRQNNLAELRWTPSNTGDFKIEVVVQDSGHPQQRATTSFRVSVVEERAADESSSEGGRQVVGFDDATQTYLVGTVFRGEQREAWFNVRTKGKLLRLSVGDTVDIGSIVGQIALIGDTTVELDTPLGKLKIKVGEALTKADDAKSPAPK